MTKIKRACTTPKTGTENVENVNQSAETIELQSRPGQAEVDSGIRPAAMVFEQEAHRQPDIVC